METPLIEAFRQKIGHENVLTGNKIKERTHHIWEMDQPLKARAVVLPVNARQVSDIMKICHSFNQPVVVHGGLTNLVGSTETQGREVVISMEKMNGILEMDTQSRTITVEAGSILQNIHLAAEAEGLMFPVTFGAKGSAQIGGVIATNAGGLKVFKYGMTRNSVLGLEVVLADGTIVSSLKKLIKDNSGYDLKQLFIGSEGTLGIITKAVLRLIAAPKSRNSAFVGFDAYEKVVGFLVFMETGLAGKLSGFELIWNDTYHALTTILEGVGRPLRDDFPYYVLLEVSGGHQQKDHLILQELLEEALEKELIADAVIAQKAADQERFWQIREQVDRLVDLCQHDQHFDISLPISKIDEYVKGVIEELNKVGEVEQYFVFGHMADGNIHLIIGKSNASQELTNRVNDIVYAFLPAYGGSISAEHGIGVHKKPYLHYSRSQEEIDLMQSLKKMMDPLGILNPGKIL
ncbi:MAG: FAD-binding oxidoreductase [Cyclobacteriaceae bacterium]